MVISMMTNNSDRMAYTALLLDKFYLLTAVICIWVLPEAVPYALLGWAIHWSIAVLIAANRQWSLHKKAKERFPFLYKKSIWIWSHNENQ